MSGLADCLTLLRAWPEIATTSGVTATNCCSAPGVSCTGDRITYLSLNGYSYSTADLGVKTPIPGLQVNPGNPIPTALFDLSEVGTLWMAGVGFTGPIPSGFPKMTQLVQLHIESNKLTGGFPDDWSQLTNLRYFHADDNLLSVLPDSNSIASINVLLKTCLIQNNRFVGTVPDGWNAGNLPGTWVDLYGNCLSGVGTWLNTRLCQVNCNWYDQQASCPGVDTSFQSKCWEVVSSCPKEIKFPANGGPVITVDPPIVPVAPVTTSSTTTTTTAAIVATQTVANTTVVATASAVATVVKTTTSSASSAVSGVVVVLLTWLAC
ncbi:hypothetical protein BCR33DRAFT_720630 [Rhizoclosmatium globosum]|uniref:L domain-like protein n=1 Tax=Rhizoclosmatium globosum TaxID=329046 RepID=A0A1Y2BVE9_9FUNG|nr:hypothetical protein BCR33DRAFT_720630 [Rhizoclosmatium globosum]|eukprot:ORY38607.1 hypothetical protein BCR33DRAFT_720630 [Rhizoclosmatium globosum]